MDVLHFPLTTCKFSDVFLTLQDLHVVKLIAVNGHHITEIFVLY